MVSPKNQTVEQITKTRDDELGRRGGEYAINEIHEGDKIIGITDGITDFLSMPHIKETFLKNSDLTTLLTDLETKIRLENPNYQGNPKRFDASSPHASDDMRCVVLQY